MDLFKRKTTEQKFEEERKIRAVTTIIRMFRNDKLKLPETEASRAMIGFCDQIDPDHKMPERDLIQKLMERQDVQIWLSSLNDCECLDNDTLRAYAEKYYKVLREVLSSPDPGAWDAWEYQSQQMIAVLSLGNINTFKEYLNNIMESDKSCPYYVKKVFNELLMMPRDSEGKASAGPTLDEEKMAEDIMRMVCPGLEKGNKDVFRALVDSLKWRGSMELKRTLEAVKNTPAERRKLRGRESCLFIETDKGVNYVG